jgi:hypothetical protein
VPRIPGSRRRASYASPDSVGIADWHRHTPPSFRISLRTSAFSAPLRHPSSVIARPSVPRFPLLLVRFSVTRCEKTGCNRRGGLCYPSRHVEVNGIHRVDGGLQMKKSILAFAVLAVLCVPMAAKANTITGVLNVTGTVEISNASIGFTDNEFYINNPAAAQQGGFAALAGTTGTIDNLTNPPDATGTVLDVPDFMTFSAAPNITITLTFLAPGIFGSAGCSSTPPATGQGCTPSVLGGQSPLSLENLSGNSSIASFSLSGSEVDSLTGDTVPVLGVFTVPLSSQNFQQLLATTADGGTVTSSFAAQFTTEGSPETAPESGTLSMMAIGIIAIGMMGLLRSRSARATARNLTAS